MAGTGVLTVFTAMGAQLPNGEYVSEYSDGLSEKALEILEFMTPEHEEVSIERFLNLHEKYLTGKKGISAKLFANDKFVDKFRMAYHSVEEIGKERSYTMMSFRTARAVLHFLFVYYFSYHEAFAASGKNIPLQTFSAWFHKLRKKAHKRMTRERAERAKAMKRLNGRRLEEHNRRLTQRLRRWKEAWQYNGYTGSFDDLKSMLHVVRYPDQDVHKILWWQVFKISERSLVVDGTVDEVRHNVLKMFRIWSRFMHPDKEHNRGHGIAVSDLLSNRLQFLIQMKQDMEKWYTKAKQRAERRKKKIKGKGYVKGRRVFVESDSDSDSDVEVVEVVDAS